MQFLQEKPMLRAALYGAVAAILIFGSIFIGSWYGCKGSGTLNGLKCVNPKEIGVCNFGEQKYVVPDSQIYYKELQDDGSLGDKEIYNLDCAVNCTNIKGISTIDGHEYYNLNDSCYEDCIS